MQKACQRRYLPNTAGPPIPFLNASSIFAMAYLKDNMLRYYVSSFPPSAMRPKLLRERDQLSRSPSLSPRKGITLASSLQTQGRETGTGMSYQEQSSIVGLFIPS